MHTPTETWDYLIVTASNDLQAAGYEQQLRLRRELGFLTGIREVVVVPDPGGRRIGSGGSTIACLVEVLNRELPRAERAAAQRWSEALRRLRILIVHAGGDSKRLPAYGPCGKIFIPVPGAADGPIGPTLFDRQIDTYLALPNTPSGTGQVVIVSGDVMLNFDPSEVRFAGEGLTALGCFGAPEQASRHGVFRADAAGQVRKYLQKPSPPEQVKAGAVDRYGRSVLDIGLMSLDAAGAVALLEMAAARPDADEKLAWTGPMKQVIERKGLDWYREICCALGRDATVQHHAANAAASGSGLTGEELRRVFEALHHIPFFLQVLPRCEFLHFGTTRQIISSGIDLLRQDRGISQLNPCLEINTEVTDAGRIAGGSAWIEGTRVRAELSLGGRNVIVGVDVDESLSLPQGACLDVVPGRSGDGGRVWFVRCYGVDDSFKDPAGAGTLCGVPIESWLKAVGAGADDVWDPGVDPDERTLWNARVFPVVAGPGDYREWLWMFDPNHATDAQRQNWRRADRRCLEEMAAATDTEEFHRQRDRIRAAEIRRSLRRLFRNDSGFSAAELAYVLSRAGEPAKIAAELLAEAHWHYGNEDGQSTLEAFVFSRIAHTLGSAVQKLSGHDDTALSEVIAGFRDALHPEDQDWAKTLDLLPSADTTAGQWAGRAQAAAFEHLHRTILRSAGPLAEPPRNALRADEIVWGRVPARLDLAGGWTDTPPYTLENGGSVINAAVNLNGQPPIHCYARVIDRPVVRLASIDLGIQVEVARLDDLLDYREATSGFALAKAALAISGFSPDRADWGGASTLQEMLERFGGGIELTTLAAIPKGSGLGTSSIVGAAILAVIQRVMGRILTPQELFHGVLRMEQALTTGGGWQDQIGGAVDGVKLITTGPGLIPDARISYVPLDVLDPRSNGGRTLLYYTGITRLAKNILQQVVGRYLDRDRAAMATLRRIHALASQVAETMAGKDLPAFGRLLHAAWRLNKELDPASSNEEVEALLDRVGPHVYGAKLLGAGGGGFLLMICKSAADAAAVRDLLASDPPNPLARFFDLDVSREGLVVTVC